jgi:hypothetical protein
MSLTTVKDKHLKLDQRKIDKAKQILGTKTETETIEMALNMLIQKNISEAERKKIVNRILNRREKIKVSIKDVAEWIEEGRRERDSRCGT